MAPLKVALAGLTAFLTISELPATASTLYVTDTTSQSLYSLSTLNGAPTLIGSFGPGSPGIIGDLAYDAKDDIMYATTTDSQNLCSINRANGAVTTIGHLGVSLMHGLAYDNVNGVLYGASTANGGLYRINAASGQATFVGSIGVNVGADNVGGLAFNPATGVLYGCISGPDYRGGLVTIDTSTGHGTSIAETQPLTDLAFQPETGTLYGIDNGVGLYPDALYRINPAAAQAVLVGQTGLDNELGLEFAPIPEPSMLSLASVGALIACVAWRRK